MDPVEDSNDRIETRGIVREQRWINTLKHYHPIGVDRSMEFFQSLLPKAAIHTAILLQNLLLGRRGGPTKEEQSHREQAASDQHL